MRALTPPSLLLTLLLTTLPPSPLLKVHAACPSLLSPPFPLLLSTPPIPLTTQTAPTSFCKCTCFTNSTIIPLDAPTAPLLLLPRHASIPPSNGGRSDPPPLPWDGADKARLPNAPHTQPAGKEEEEEEENGDEKQQTSEPEPKHEKENHNPASSPEATDEKEKEKEKENRPGTCADCNRQFCLDYNLPICKHARVEDVFTTCFRTFPCPLIPLSFPSSLHPPPHIYP